MLPDYNFPVRNIVLLLEEKSRFLKEKKFIQHGNVSVYDHSIYVAIKSFQVAKRINKLFHISVDFNSLIRGALLHDYFLYDWHENEKWHKWHGFRHPRFALNNAKRDFNLTKKETDIILHHMFPLTPVPPLCIESWIVCIVDTLCATKEIFKKSI